MSRRWTEADIRARNRPLLPTTVTAVRPKYGNKKVEADGYVFDSKSEAARYWTLRLQQKAGAITDLDVHPRYELHVCGIKVGKFTLDFRYRREGHLVIEDVKQPHTRTTAYRLRKRMLKAEYGLDISEVLCASHSR